MIHNNRQIHTYLRVFTFTFDIVMWVSEVCMSNM